MRISNAPELFRLPLRVQPKYSDAGPLVINCSIKGTTFIGCTCDTGASISIMPLSVARLLNLQKYKTQVGRMTLADQSTTREGVLLENVPVVVDNVMVLTDFAVIDMGVGPDSNPVLGRPFLQSTNASLDMISGVIQLKFDSFHRPRFARNGTVFNSPPTNYLEKTLAKGKGNPSNPEEFTAFTISFSEVSYSQETPKKETRTPEVPIPTSVKRLEDPGPLTITCSIKNTFFRGCLCDTGASTCIMPLSIAKRLGLKIETCDNKMRLADQTSTDACGKVKEVQVMIEGVIVPTEFTIIDMVEEPEYHLLFGRSFLASTNAQMDVLTGEITLSLEAYKRKVFLRNGKTFDLPPEPLYSPTKGPDWFFNEQEEKDQSWDTEIEQTPSPLSTPDLR